MSDKRLLDATALDNIRSAQSESRDRNPCHSTIDLLRDHIDAQQDDIDAQQDDITRLRDVLESITHLGTYCAGECVLIAEAALALDRTQS